MCLSNSNIRNQKSEVIRVVFLTRQTTKICGLNAQKFIDFQEFIISNLECANYLSLKTDRIDEQENFYLLSP